MLLGRKKVIIKSIPNIKKSKTLNLYLSFKRYSLKNKESNINSDVIKSEHLKGIHPIVTIKNIKNLFRIKGFIAMKFF